MNDQNQWDSSTEEPVSTEPQAAGGNGSGGPGGPRKRRKIRKRVIRRGKLFTLAYIAAALAACLFLSIFCISAINDVLAVSKPNQAVEVQIPSGSTTKEIAHILKENGLIKYPFMFEIISDFENYDGKYQFGSFILNSNMDYTSMMSSMKKQTAQRETVMVTIPEGVTLQKMGAILEENGVCEAADFISTLQNTSFGYSFEDDIPQSSLLFYRMEGYLFPDTYEFYKSDTSLNVIKKILNNFESKIDADIKAQMRKKGLTLHELLTLASIIQAEAPNSDQMAMVSSVYNNRLNDKLTFPKLQADPTTKYANEVVTPNLGDRSKDIVTAYDTYQGDGLPPGPINNPGLDAIVAALNPADTNYTYFCTDLRSGVFYYADNLRDHESNLVKAGLR